MMLLSGYCLAIFVAAVIGAWLPRKIEMTHTRTQLIMSFVAALMLGVACYHLIPHSVNTLNGDIDFTMQWVMAGLIFMLLLLRLFHFHQHDFGDESHACHDGDANHHDLEHAHDHAHAKPSKSSFSWMGLAFGLSVHTVIDGLALGAVMHSDTHHAGILGIGVFLAILLHKPLDALSIEMVMAASGWRIGTRRIMNFVFAALAPLTAVLVYAGLDVSAAGSLLLPGMLAFSAGAFICIALGDLLPEVQFHSHDRVKLTLGFLAGIGLALLIGVLEAGH